MGTELDRKDGEKLQYLFASSLRKKPEITLKDLLPEKSKEMACITVRYK